MDQAIKQRLIIAQRNELTEYFIYRKLAHSCKDKNNADVLKHISHEELEHHNIWKGHTGTAVKPYRFRIWLYYLISRVFGITFAIKLMESGEEGAQVSYDDIARFVLDARAIMEDEHQHEQELMAMIDEERLRYTGAIVRGLNEALVELTGALSGLTFALQSENLIATSGIIIGLVMSLSLAGTEYLATKAEDGRQRPCKAALYTGFANLVTVLFLVFPYLLPINIFAAMGWMITNAIIAIYIFNFYSSVTRGTSMRRGFFEMAFISLGIASVAFLIGLLARTLWHIEV